VYICWYVGTAADLCLGVVKLWVRFRQHLQHEMAHYAGATAGFQSFTMVSNVPWCEFSCVGEFCVRFRQQLQHEMAHYAGALVRQYISSFFRVMVTQHGKLAAS
jgi:glycyl-tRNA synthetase (class II)